MFADLIGPYFYSSYYYYYYCEFYFVINIFFASFYFSMFKKLVSKGTLKPKPLLSSLILGVNSNATSDQLVAIVSQILSRWRFSSRLISPTLTGPRNTWKQQGFVSSRNNFYIRRVLIVQFHHKEESNDTCFQVVLVVVWSTVTKAKCWVLLTTVSSVSHVHHPNSEKTQDQLSVITDRDKNPFFP